MPIKVAQTFSPDEMPSFEKLCAEAAKIRAKITGNEREGKIEIEKYGVKGEYSITQDEIAITVTGKPFLMPEIVVRKQIEGWLAAFKS